MMSRFTSMRDHATLLHAFNQVCVDLPEFSLRLSLAGTGETMLGMRQMADTLPCRNSIEFLGLLTEKELVAFLKKTDIYVHSSLGETMSTALMQVMAQGLPIIATNIPGIHNMIESGQQGILFPPKDIEALASSIKNLIQNPILAQKLGDAALKKAQENYTSQIMFSRYQELFPQ